MQPGPGVIDLAKRVSLLALDCDGVLTDGRLYYAGTCVDHKGEGGENKRKDDSLFALAFYAQDGHAIKMLMQSGVEVAIISGRSSTALEQRAKELGISHVFSNVTHKGKRLKELMRALKLRQGEVAAMGDDIPDLALFAAAGLTIAPADSHPIVRDQAHHVTKAAGGRGAVREAVQLIMSAQNSLAPMLETFREQ